MEYVIFYRDQRAMTGGYWHRSPRYCQNSGAEALKQYAMRVKEYGMQNVIFAEVPQMTCVSVEVLYDGQTENSQ